MVDISLLMLSVLPKIVKGYVTHFTESVVLDHALFCAWSALAYINNLQREAVWGSNPNFAGLNWPT